MRPPWHVTCCTMSLYSIHLGKQASANLYDVDLLVTVHDMQEVGLCSSVCDSDVKVVRCVYVNSRRNAAWSCRKYARHSQLC